MIIQDKYQILPNDTNQKDHYSHVARRKGDGKLLGWCDKKAHTLLAVDTRFGMLVSGSFKVHDELMNLVKSL